MKIAPNIILKLKIIFLLFLLTSCITKSLWHPQYEEKIDKFMISADGQYVIFLAKEYHYILHDKSGEIKNLLFSKYRRLMFVDGTKSEINLSLNNEITANVVVRLVTSTLNQQIKQDLSGLGFIMHNAYEDVSFRTKLSGIRYRADPNIKYLAGPLNYKYSIMVHEPISPWQKVQKAALTPLTLTIDAGLTIGEVLVWPFQD